MAANFARHDFASREELAAALTSVVAAQLDEAIASRGKAVLAVSGGSTPALFFKTLSQAALDWAKVVVTLVDERFVAETSPRSNAALVKANLLQDRAAAARFLPLASPLEDIAQATSVAEVALRLFGLPLDVVVLGMGNDGHTASFFPDADELEQVLVVSTPRLVSPVHAASADEPRLTLTLPVIASARFIALHIEGAEKQETLERALSRGGALPIRRVIDAAETPVEIFWAA